MLMHTAFVLAYDAARCYNINVSEDHREFDSSAEIGIFDRISRVKNITRSRNVIPIVYN